MGKTKTTATIPPSSEFLDTLETANDNCIALLAVKSREVKIPANIRAQMRNVGKLVQYWSKAKTVYNGLVEAASTRAARAGA